MSQAPPAAPTKNPYKVAIVAVVITCLVLIGTTGALLAVLNHRLNLTSATVGECVRLNADGVGSRQGCADSDATHVILAVEAGTRACVEVAGATSAVEAGAKTLCLGVKGADVSTAVNVAQVGDCLLLQGNSAERSACRTGAREILEILRNQLRAGTPSLGLACRDVEGADAAYAWSLESSNRAAVGTYDLIFCLGPVRR